MKWRPISRLIDEQRDWNWYYFIYSDDYSNASLARWNGKSWENPQELGKDLWIEERYSMFLDSAIPDPRPKELPKPQKMEWRRFNEESPNENQLILVCEKAGSKPFIVSFCDGLTNYKVHWFWMPIEMPKDE